MKVRKRQESRVAPLLWPSSDFFRSSATDWKTPTETNSKSIAVFLLTWNADQGIKSFSLATAVNDLRVSNGHRHTYCPSRLLTLEPVMIMHLWPNNRDHLYEIRLALDERKVEGQNSCNHTRVLQRISATNNNCPSVQLCCFHQPSNIFFHLLQSPPRVVITDELMRFTKQCGTFAASATNYRLLSRVSRLVQLSRSR